MPAAFSRTTRALVSDSALPAVWAWLVAAALLTLWTAWFVLARVQLHEVSLQARLEVQQAAHPLAALHSARVVRSALQLGREVVQDEVLVELDAGPARLQWAEERARLQSLDRQADALQHEVATRQQGLAPDAAAQGAALQAAQARSREAAAALAWAVDQEKRLREESAAGSVPAVDALQARAERDKLAATLDALTAEARRLQAAAAARAGEQQAQVQALQRTLAALQGERAAAAQAVQRLQLDIDSHVVRSPVAGRIGELAPLRVGEVVAAGQKFATVVPAGRLIVVADFDPRAVLGRVHAGQPAQLRLDGFPWAQFGSLPAIVSRVASELRDGRVRVEFTPDGDWSPRAAAAGITLQHGLPGAVEVTVENTSPAALLLRAVGRRLGDAGATPASTVAAR